MSEYTPFPDPDLYTPGTPSQEPRSQHPEPHPSTHNPDTARYIPAPTPGDHPYTTRPLGFQDHGRRLTTPDTLVIGPDYTTTVYAVESRAPHRRDWQIRPFNEHPGGRAFRHHHRRMRDVPGVHQLGALMFSDIETAYDCVTVLQDARYDMTEFRVRRICVAMTSDIMPERRGYGRQASRRNLPHRAPDFSTTVPASLGALGSWLGAQQTITPARNP